MRTTVTLDPDVLAMLRDEMKRSDRPFKQVLNQAVRRGLLAEDAAGSIEPFRTEPHSFGFKPGIDLDKLNQLVDELDADAFRDRQERAG
ncbi:MAG: antitoxin [Actinomycetota bacterium]